MFKLCLILALSAGLVAAQEAPSDESAPEPYSYGYSTDTHSAQEQRGPDGKVTGSYMLVGEDGRERRVEYIADENGFHAKVATNEVGTKSESPADVELHASEPTPAQYAYVPQQVQYAQQQQQQQVQYAQQQIQQVQRGVAAAAPVSQTAQQPGAYRQVDSSSYYQYPQNIGYGYGYGNSNSNYPGARGYGVSNGYYTASGRGGYQTNALGYGYPSAPVYSGSGIVDVGNYNNHLPSQFYKSYSSSSTVGAPAVSSYRYVSGVQPVAGVTSSSSSVRTVGVSSTPNNVGSPNYLVLQKRATVNNEGKAVSS